jgi:hypothetical protein
MDQWQNDDDDDDDDDDNESTAAAAASAAADDESSRNDGGDREGWLGDNECCICFEAAMAVKLVPCGHVALCALCAHRLQPPKCPLCRKNFTAVRALHQRSSQKEVDATAGTRMLHDADDNDESNKKNK